MQHLPEKFLCVLCAASAVCLTACGDGSYRVPDNIMLAVAAPQPEQPDMTSPVTEMTTEAAALTTLPETTATEAVTTTEAPAETTVVTTAAPTEQPDQIPDENGLTPEDYAFLSDTVFVGDSICSGLRVYHMLDDNHVLAQGSVGARNIAEYTFNVNGAEVGITYGLSVLQPKYVIFSMGMNDINLSTPEQYCQNYDILLNSVHSVLPDAALFVASITPIGAESDFTTNDKIDLYNATIQAHLGAEGYGYLDIASALKSPFNVLKPEYSGGDGIHLQSPTYYVYLQRVCELLVDTKTVGGYANGIAYGSART